MQRGSKLLVAYAALYLVFLYGPVLLLPLFSFNDSLIVAFPLQGFTTQWYSDLLGNEELKAAFGNSLRLGVTVSVISTILGILAAKAVSRRHLPGARAITAAIMLPMVIPSIVLGIALLMLARYLLDISLSLWTVGAGHVLLCLPFSMLIMAARFEGFDRNLEEASLDLGQSQWSTFRRVTLPLAMPGVVASLLLCLTVSLDEFVLAFFLSGNETTLPIFIFSQLRFPNRLPSVLALGSFIIVASFGVVVLAEWLRRWGVQGSRRGF